MRQSSLYPRPSDGDCPEFYFRYISLVPEVDILTYLHTQRDWFGDFVDGITDDQARFRYAPGKWTLSEMIGHVLDSERVFAYRMMAISRGDQNKFPGFEQDDYVKNSIYSEVSPAELANEWRAVRSSTIYLARHADAEMVSRVGTANNLPIRASSFPYILAGHVIHHHQVAKERYLPEQ